MKTKTTQLKERTLLVQKSGDQQWKITIPPGARVTFGPTIPYKDKHGGIGQRDGYSLRVYSGKGQDTLLAVFCDVVSFRDITLPCAKLIVREAGKALWKSDEDGFKVEQEVNVQRSFENLKLIEG